MPDYENIRLEIEDGLGTLTFAVPQYSNALDIAALQEVLDAFYRIEEREDVGALVLTGEGDRAFCAGINLKEIPLGDGDAAIDYHFRYKAMWWHQVMHQITRMRLPVLAAVNGVAAGGGLGIVLASDMAVCVDSARFLCSWHANGIANDGATSYTLAKIVGFRRAMELMLTNETLDAQQALEWGIVNRVYPREDFADAVAMIASDLAAGPTHLQAMAKERFHMGWRQSIEECTEYEIQNIMDSLRHPYFKAQLERFLTKAGRSDQVKVRLP
jgi:2-(1,2-epoxy-1,2-dihydrophenyl)acetyl-CoA isomerase